MINFINLFNVLLGNLFDIKKITVPFKTICLVCAQYKKMVPFKKILSQIMNGLHTNHFCSMGTIMKFLINMEVPTDASVMRHVQRVFIQNDDSDSH
jgi:hypothetical protein